jgi:HEAT repeat protein
VSEPNSIAIRKRDSLKRRLVLLLAVAAGVSAVFWLLHGFDRQPRYQGKQASYWLDRTDNAREELRPSDEAFAAMGKDALSFLVRTLGKKPAWHARKLSEFASNRQLPAWLGRQLPNTRHLQFRRVMAAYYLAKLGPETESALSVLWRIVEDPGEDGEIKSTVLSVLFSMGEKAAPLMPEYLRCLKNGNAESRMMAAWLLGSLGEKGKPAVPALAEALRDPAPSVRKAVFDALVNLGASPEDLTHILGGLLRDSQSRAETLNQLAAFRSAGKQTAAALAEVFPACSGSEKQQILYLLERVGSQASPAVPTLIDALSHNDGEIRYLAARVLGEVGPEAKSAIPSLRERLNDENDMIKTAAANALNKINANSTVDPAVIK